MTKTPNLYRLGRTGLALTFALGGLTACGKDDEPTPTATPTIVATVPPVDTTAQTNAGLTVGSLADRIGAAWSNVTSYRAVTTTNAGNSTGQAGTPGTGASPFPAAPVIESTDEIVLPDRKRRTTRANGDIQYELISVDGKVYARGSAAPGLDPSRPDPDTWVEIDPSAPGSEASDAGDYVNFAMPVSAPYSGLSAEERSRDAVPLGETTVDGRTCLAYRIADTTNTGERIEIVLSLGADDLPCSIETRAGGLVTTTVFTYNIPLTVEAPEIATPAPSGT